MADMLATPEDLASFLQREDLDLATTTLVMEAATAVVQEAAGGQRILLVEDDEFTLIGGSEGWLDLPQRPVVSVASVTVNGITVATGTASGTWRLSGNSIWRDTGWQPEYFTPSAVAGVYTHGYAPGAQELQLARSATLSLARAAYSNPVGVTREAIDDYSVAYEAAAAALDVSPHLRAALRRQYGRRAGLVRVA